MITFSRIVRSPFFIGLFLLLLLSLPGSVSASPARPTSSGVVSRHAAHSIPNAPGTFTTYADSTPNGGPWDITDGPDGNLYYTDHENAPSDIVQIIPSSGAQTVCPLPSGYTQPEGIIFTSGNSTLLWFAMVGPPSAIGSIDTLNFSNCTFSFYTTGLTANSQPFDITEGPDDNLWFTEYHGNRIGYINPNPPNYTITECPVIPHANSVPFGITSAFGKLWFTSRMDTASPV